MISLSVVSSKDTEIGSLKLSEVLSSVIFEVFTVDASRSSVKINSSDLVTSKSTVESSGVEPDSAGAVMSHEKSHTSATEGLELPWASSA